MTSRRRRPHYRPAAIGYRASRWKARLPRQAGLTGVHFRSVLRFASGFQPTRPRGKDLGCAKPASTSCSCLRLLVASNRPHKGLSPSIIHPCPTHVRLLRLRLSKRTGAIPWQGYPDDGEWCHHWGQDRSSHGIFWLTSVAQTAKPDPAMNSTPAKMFFNDEVDLLFILRVPPSLGCFPPAFPQDRSTSFSSFSHFSPRHPRPC